MERPSSFQEVIMTLERFWAEQGCLIWQPYSEKVGAGTMNPATVLRVLGPEPWNVAYVEPSYRPDDGRYAQNPNRMQLHYQYQVILKPDPGNPQELYLESLEALGINRREHDIRFVEDNWESPALGAWGLGWEVWLDGLEITQFTYFQQAGGVDLDPVAVEITYGLERIVMFLQGVSSVWEIDWDGRHTYGEILKPSEVEHCIYNFELADVERLTQLYDIYEAEARSCLERGLVVPAHDYLLRCSHTFNILDARGAIGVTERARYFARMRELARGVAEAYLKQREEMGYPWRERPSAPAPKRPSIQERVRHDTTIQGHLDALLEIGTEELPARDLSLAIEQLREAVPRMLEEARLEHGGVRIAGTPRRLVVYVEGLAPKQRDVEKAVKGPPAQVAYDAEGKPTRAAIGFAKSQGVALEDLEVREIEGGKYVVAVKVEEGRPAMEVLAELWPQLIASLRFPLTMRWNETGVAFSRPIRWLVALLGDAVVPFEYAGVRSGRTTRGLRPQGSPEIVVGRAEDYFALMEENGIVVDVEKRREMIRRQAERLAAEVGGRIPDDPALLEEVANLVEHPTALRGSFDPEYLKLPKEVLITVMKKHQRYFPVVGKLGNGKFGRSQSLLLRGVPAPSGRRGRRPVAYHCDLLKLVNWEGPHSTSQSTNLPDTDLLPHFIAVRNGDAEHLDIVRRGNEEVIRARFADAAYFYKVDTGRKLEDYLPRLDTLIFQERLGSMLDKVGRLERLVPRLGEMLGLSDEEMAVARRAARLCKADLVTQMVVEFTSLQGVMGREYALLSGEEPAVAEAIFEHYLPRFAGDRLPEGRPGIVVGLADRLDSLCGLFAAGLVPTGSADPYGLRRAALGVVQVLIGREISLDLREALAEAAKLLPVAADEEVLREVLAFVEGRLRVLLLEEGFRHDVVDAVLAERGHDPFLAYRTVRAFVPWVARDDWMDLLNAYARCVRIVRGFEVTFPLDPSRFVEPSARRLYEAYLACRDRVGPESTIDELLAALRSLVEPITAFFDDVLVMCEDRALRENRLALLQRIAALTEGIVDLTKMEGF